MSVTDRWHKSRPKQDETPCRDHGKVPTREHGEPGRWQVRWRDEDRDQRAKNFDTKADAVRWDSKNTTDLATGAYVSPVDGKIKFREYADQWQAIQIHRDATAALTERAFRRYIYPAIGDISLNLVKPSRIQAMVKSMSTELAPNVVVNYYGYVASVFKMAVRDRIIGMSPCAGIKLPDIPRRKVYVPTLEQLTLVSGYLPACYQAVPLIAARTGLRPSELLGLEVDCVDFLRREIHVRQQLIITPAKGNGAYLGPTKTVNSVRTVPVDQDTIDLIAAHLARFPARDTEITDRTDLRYPRERTAELLFLSATGAPVKRSTWTGTWQPAAQKTGFPARTGLHCCRHFYASALIRHGASVKTVQAMLGHSSAVTTLNVYGHLWPDSDDQVRAAITTVFRETVPGPAGHADQA